MQQDEYTQGSQAQNGRVLGVQGGDGAQHKTQPIPLPPLLPGPQKKEGGQQGEKPQLAVHPRFLGIENVKGVSGQQ